MEIWISLIQRFVIGKVEYPLSAATCEGTCIQSTVHELLEVPFQPVTKVLEHGGSSRKNNVLC